MLKLLSLPSSALGLHLNAGLVLTCLTGLQISADWQQRAWQESAVSHNE